MKVIVVMLLLTVVVSARPTKRHIHNPVRGCDIRYKGCIPKPHIRQRHPCEHAEGWQPDGVHRGFNPNCQQVKN